MRLILPFWGNLYLSVISICPNHFDDVHDLSMCLEWYLNVINIFKSNTHQDDILRDLDSDLGVRQ